jgi:hypothetical protein
MRKRQAMNILKSYITSLTCILSGTCTVGMDVVEKVNWTGPHRCHPQQQKENIDKH